MKNLIGYFLLVSLLTSCLSPDEIIESQDSDLKSLNELIRSQSDKINGTTLDKRVITNQQSSQKTIVIDSSFFTSDFSILDGKDFGKVFHKNSYEKKQEGNNIVYTRDQKEKNGPVFLKIEKDNSGNILSFSIKELDDNVLFKSQITVSYTFDAQQNLTGYSIKGLQKLIGLDQNVYEIIGKINVD